MAPFGKKSLSLLKFLFLLLPLCSIDLNSTAQAIVVDNAAALRQYGAPSRGEEIYTPAAIMVAANRATFYLWRDNCPNDDDGVKHIKPVAGESGCWERSTNNYLMAGDGIVRVGDTFSADGTIARVSLVRDYHVQDSTAAAQANARAMTPGPQGPQGIQGPAGTNAQNPSFSVATGAAGSNVSLSGTYPNLTLTIPRGNTGQNGADGAAGANAANPNFTVATGTAGSNATISGTYPNLTLTVPRGSDGVTGATGAAGPTYTAGTGIAIASNIISTTGLRGTDLGTVTLTQTAAIAIALGPRTVTITGVTGLQVGDRIVLTPTGDTPAGYLVGDAWCTTAGTLKVNIYAPALALGASYSFQVKVTALR